MIWGLLVPMVVAIVAAFSAAILQRRLRPDFATWILTLLAGGSALAVLWAVGVLALGFAVEQPGMSAVFGWCQALFSSHDRVPFAVGLAAWMALAAMLTSAVRTLHRRRSAARHLGGPLLTTETPIAFVVPGRPGTIVVSTGMLKCLDSAEQRALFAHERAHLRHKHHRFLRVAELAESVAPVLRPLSAQVRYSTERWADEDAASELGDRRLVARAIARAALAASGEIGPTPELGFIGLTTTARVEAMLNPPQRLDRSTIALAGFALVAVSISLAGSGVQFHHLVQFMQHICRF